MVFFLLNVVFFFFFFFLSYQKEKKEKREIFSRIKKSCVLSKRRKYFQKKKSIISVIVSISRLSFVFIYLYNTCLCRFRKINKTKNFLGVQSRESLPNKFNSSTTTTMMMRVHDHENQHRQFPSSKREEVDVASGFSSLQQPFHRSTTTTTPPSTYTAFKSPGMETSSTVGFPFTNAQWKELERQAMIYKYMAASVPVPLDLLLPITTSGNLSSSSSSSPLVGELKLRYSKGTTDPEPGRCKRTDGKKWRCSKDVAPDQKYCERHMHRGRPRSRKHVELHVNNNNYYSNNNSSSNNKRTRLGHNNNNNNNGLATTLASCNSSQTSHFLGDSNTVLQYHPSPVLEPLLSLLSSDKEPRSLEWVPMAAAAGADDSRWLHLMHQPKLEMTSKPSSSMFTQEEPFLNLNSYANFTTITGEAENDKDCFPFLNPDDVVSQTQETNHHGKKLSPWWLSPPPPTSSWAGSPFGGPLAEVLRPSAASDPPSPFTGNGDSGSPPATVASSPSGVLQKTLNAASLSDSSGCSNSSRALGSSNAKPEISLL